MDGQYDPVWMAKIETLEKKLKKANKVIKAVKAMFSDKVQGGVAEVQKAINDFEKVK